MRTLRMVKHLKKHNLFVESLTILEKRISYRDSSQIDRVIYSKCLQNHNMIIKRFYFFIVRFSFSIDPTVRHSWLSIVTGGFFTQVSLYSINQTQIQRFLTMKDYKTAVTALWCSLPLVILISVLTSFSGLAMFSKYYSCDPIK